MSRRLQVLFVVALLSFVFLVIRTSAVALDTSSETSATVTTTSTVTATDTTSVETRTIETTSAAGCTLTISPADLSKQAYVKKWAKRINKYLKGSPLHGKGEQFALAAYPYRNTLDPRLSVVIAMKESGLGRAGSLARKHHNAWGWYHKSFSSWNAGIKAHAKYLHRMYLGGKLTLRMAHRYCPPSYKHWYKFCKHQMSLI